MCTLNPVRAWLGLVVLICATGCSNEADLSPDGRTLAVTKGDSLELHDSAGKRPVVHIDIEDVGSPKYSPDGKWLLVDQGSQRSETVENGQHRVIPKQTVVFSSEGLKEFALPKVLGPFAWRPDGTEFVGIDEKNACVVHVRSKQVVRTYSLPERPTRAIWLGGRDLAFGSGQWLTIIRNGSPKSIKVEHPTDTVGFDAKRNRVLWIEVKTDTGKDQLPLNEVFLKAVDLADLKVKVITKLSGPTILDCAGHIGLPESFAFSADASKLVIAGISDNSPTGVLSRFSELGGFGDKNGKTKSQLAELRELKNQLKLCAVCATTSLIDDHIVPEKKFSKDLGSNPELDVSPFWVQDSGDLVVRIGDKVFRL